MLYSPIVRAILIDILVYPGAIQLVNVMGCFTGMSKVSINAFIGKICSKIGAVAKKAIIAIIAY